MVYRKSHEKRVKKDKRYSWEIKRYVIVKKCEIEKTMEKEGER